MKHIKLFEQFLNESNHNVWEPVENSPSPKAYKSHQDNYIINMDSKRVNGPINKLIKKPKAVEGEGYKILADADGSIVFFEVTAVAQEVAKALGGEAVARVTLANGKTEAASSRGGAFVTIK